MQLKPFGHKILVEVRDAQAPASGLVLPETSAPVKPYGLVVDVGDLCTRVTVGMRVVFDYAGGIQMNEPGAEVPLLVLDEGSVFGLYVDAPLIKPFTIGDN